MLQVWRIQQVAQILTLILLGVTDSLLLWGKVQWRGGILGDHFAGPVIFLLIIALAVWAFAIVWDLGLRMWHDQAVVLVEKNPYTRERLSTKEMVQYSLIWIPILEKLGKDDKKLADTAEVLKVWVRSERKEDPQLAKDIEKLFEHIKSDRIDLIGLEDKKQK